VLSSLPGDLVTWRTFFLPFRDRKRLDQTVPFELETQVPFGLDEVVIDYYVLHRDRSGTTVLAALVQRRDLEAHLELLNGAGLDPKVVDLAPLATLNILSLLGNELPDTFVYVGGNSRRAVVALYRNRQLVGLRTLVVPVAASGDDTDPTASNNGHATGEAQWTAALIAEIRWTLLALNGAPLDAGLPCFVAGEGWQFDRLAQEIEPAIDVAVRRLDNAPLRNVPAALRAEVATFASPLGLALREVSPNDALGVNFRQGEFAYHRGQDELRRALWRTAVVAALVITLVIANTYMEYQRLASRLAVLQNQIRTVFSQTLPDVRRIVDERTQLQTEIDAAQKQLQILSGLAPVGGITAVDVLRTITATLPETIKLDTDEYIMDPDSVRLKAKTDSFETVDSIKQQLLNARYFGDVQVKDVKTAADGKVDFRLILLLSKEGGSAPAKP
jgi:general secretion pathway protein L